MRDSVLAMVDAIEPWDEIEVEHRRAVINWIESGATLCRSAKPATPATHLVSYCVLVDHDRRSIFLVDHRDAGRWLPTGGHVEPGEHPAVAATRTVGLSESHVDVSVWFVFEGSVDDVLFPDAGEFTDARWWNFDDVVHGPDSRFGPHLPRFVDKLRRATSGE